MRRALELAERGWGQVTPNPLVGAVVVRDGETVGEGYHAMWGGPHAEVEALREAGGRSRGATLHVTLEPCHHRGKTGPCSRAILEAGIARVVSAIDDPNPEASGGGAWLREHGIEFESGVCQQEASDLNAVHLTASREGRPFVALKYAMSLDGRLAETAGESTRISGESAIREAHRLRAGHQAIVVGSGTALADDPQLTVRHWESPRVPPVRVVLDSQLRLPPGSKLAQTARQAPVLVFTAEDAPTERSSELERLGVEVERVRRSSDGIDLERVLLCLWERGTRAVLCEGGGKLGSALLAAGLIDRVYTFIAPLLFGEPGVLAFQGERGCAARNWRLITRTALGPITLLALSPSSAEREGGTADDV